MFENIKMSSKLPISIINKYMEKFLDSNNLNNDDFTKCWNSEENQSRLETYIEEYKITCAIKDDLNFKKNKTPFCIFKKDKYEFFRTAYPNLSKKELKTFIITKWNEIIKDNPLIYEKYKQEAILNGKNDKL